MWEMVKSEVMADLTLNKVCTTLQESEGLVHKTAGPFFFFKLYCYHHVWLLRGTLSVLVLPCVGLLLKVRFSDLEFIEI
jgi:hypothetical protein